MAAVCSAFLSVAAMSAITATMLLDKIAKEHTWLALLGIVACAAPTTVTALLGVFPLRRGGDSR